MTFVGSSIFTYGWSSFVNPIIATFGWTMTQLSLANSLRGLETGIFNPIWGAVVDRYSPRKLMIFGAIFTAAGIFCLSQTRNLAMYYIGFLIVGLGGSLVTGILPTTVITRWFNKNLGRANGIFYMGLGLGGVFVPVVTFLIDKFSWRTTLIYASIIYFVLGISYAFIIRSRPEAYGLLPDGKTTSDTQTLKRGNPRSGFSTGIRELFKMRAFWHINIVTLFQNMAMATVNLYIIPYLTNIGLSRTRASLVISIFTFVSLFVRIPFGMLADVASKKYVIAATLLLMGIGLFIFGLLGGGSTFSTIILFGVIYGLGMGGVMVLRPPILAEYFGTRNFGTVFGVSSIFITIASISSTPIAGWIFDTYHSYKPWWLAMAIFSGIAVILMLTIPPPRRRVEESTPQTAPGRVSGD
jgi:MFS family permease